MHFRIEYLTGYTYDDDVADNLNAVRARPANTSSQRCDEFHVRTDPEARLHRYVDYFGTEVVEYGIDRPHDHMTIDVQARVTTSEPDDPPEGDWDGLRTTGYRTAGGEFLLPTETDPPSEMIAEMVELTRGTSPRATVDLVTGIVHDRFVYDTSTTYVGSTVRDLLESGGGVCQDFAHLAVVLLRAHGIAARYVSGYYWSSPQDGGLDSVEVETHAWTEALLPGGGEQSEPSWVGIDPTNGIRATATHVKIGHGRFYQDVPPIRGVYRGTAGAAPEVRVRMTRLDPQESARA